MHKKSLIQELSEIIKKKKKKITRHFLIPCVHEILVAFLINVFKYLFWKYWKIYELLKYKFILLNLITILSSWINIFNIVIEITSLKIVF